MIKIWTEERYTAILGCGQYRIRCRLFWLVTVTLWRWSE
jgi:hypothetical protein